MKACRLLIEEAGGVVLSKRSEQVLHSLLELGFDVHRQLSRDNPEASVSTSPFSTLSFLAMAYAGAEGTTAEEIGKALHLSEGIKPAQVLAASQLLMTHLKTERPGVTSSMGSLLVRGTSSSLLSDFSTDIHYFLETKALTIGLHEPLNLWGAVGSFLADKTNGRFSTYQGAVPPNTLHLSAGYFKSDWEMGFRPEYIDPNYSFLNDTSERPLPMMFHRDTLFPYYQEEAFQMVSLAFTQGTYALDIILPARSGEESYASSLLRLENKLTTANYRRWVDSLTPERLRLVGIPRWQAASLLTDDYRKALAARVPSLFATPNLFRMCRDACHFSQVIQANVIEVDEGSNPPPPRYGVGTDEEAPVVVAYRPFLAIIRHVPTNTPLYIMSERRPIPLPPARSP